MWGTAQSESQCEGARRDKEAFPRSQKQLEIEPPPSHPCAGCNQVHSLLWEAHRSLANALPPECPVSALLPLFFLCLLFGLFDLVPNN